MKRLFALTIVLGLAACGGNPPSADALDLRNTMNAALRDATHYAEDNPARCSPTVPPPCGDQRLINEAAAAQVAAMPSLEAVEKMAREADAAASNPLAKAPDKKELSGLFAIARARVRAFTDVVDKMRAAVKRGEAR